MGRMLALAAALIVGALIAWASQQPPPPRPVTAPAGEFSAARAMPDVGAIAKVPHPTGSAANVADRNYLLGRMSALGLSPQVRRGIAVTVTPGRIQGGPVENLLGVLPGRDRAAPALLLMAHYDSVPNSPGASDDAAGVSTALEVVRAIKARGVPARDVMVLLTDGEEVDLSGANAFFRRDPEARHVGFVINLEARGSRGRVIMFQAGKGDGPAIAAFSRHAVRPMASSLTGFIYSLMPNDTDFTESMRAGLPGLNFAFLGGQFDYHSASSTPSTMDRGTLQDMGDQALAVAAALANAPALPAHGADAVFSQVFGDIVLHYPTPVGWAVLTGAALLIAIGLWRARRAGVVTTPDVLRGLAGGIYVACGAAAVLHVARQAVGVSHAWVSGRALLAEPSRWEAAVMLIAIGFLLFGAAQLARGRRSRAIALMLAAALAGCGFARGFDPVAVGGGLTAALAALLAYGRPAARPAAWAGVLILGLALTFVAQALAPAAAFMLAWPLTAGALAAAATALGARRSYGGLALIAALAAITAGWLGAYAHMAYLSLDMPELLVLVLLPASFVLWPLAQPAEGAPEPRVVGPALMIVAAVVLLLVRFEAPWSARHPQAGQVAYVLDQDAGKAWRIDASGGPTTAWARTVLTADGGRIGRQTPWFFGGWPVQAAAAKMLARPSPTLALAKRPDGLLTFDAAAPAGARILSLQLRPDTPVGVVAVNGVRATDQLSPTTWTIVHWEPAAGGVHLTLRPGGPGALQVRVLTITDGWPADAAPLPPRPRDLMPFNNSDVLITTGSHRFAW